MAGEARPMQQHVSILGVLYIIFGVLGIVAAMASLALFGGAAGIVRMVAPNDPDAAVAIPILGMVGVVLFVLIFFLSIPGLVVGIGLTKFRPWSRVGGLVLSGLNLLNFPLGTALGVYGLWVLLSKETEVVFSR
jgi:hypothetical protein